MLTKELYAKDYLRIARSYMDLAKCLLRDKQFNEAKKNLKAAMDVSTMNKASQELIGSIHILVGDVEREQGNR